jgi:hypothetical protein
MQYIASVFLLVLCSTCASAFEQRGDVVFDFGGPSGEALEIACQSNNTKYLVCDYSLKGFIDGLRPVYFALQLGHWSGLPGSFKCVVSIKRPSF